MSSGGKEDDPPSRPKRLVEKTRGNPMIGERRSKRMATGSRINQVTKVFPSD